MGFRLWMFGAAVLVLAAAFPVQGQQIPPPPPTAKASAMPAPAPAAPAPGRPVCKVESLSLDLGEIKEGEDAVGVFKIQNTGDAELKILSARPG